MRSLGALLRETAEREPSAPAFVEPGRVVTYADWDEASDRAAAALAALGAGPGSIVALLLPNGADYAIAYLGAVKAGCVASGINPRYGERETGAILARLEPDVLVTDGPERPPARRVVAPRVVAPRDLHAAGSAGIVEPLPDDPVVVVWTSGTTGDPKGAVYTAGALEAVRRIEMTLDPAPHPRTLGALPMPHMNFMTKAGYAIERAACTVVPPGKWTAASALEAIERERLTVVGGVPTQMELMLRDPSLRARDLSSLRGVVLGGAPVTPDLVRRLREAFGAPVAVRYSCTEVGLAAGTRPDDSDEVVATTVGRALPEVQIRVDAAPGEVGEVVVRSPAMMREYWRDPQGTRAALDADGFFHTGDLGSLDADGLLRLRGRAKDMYIRGGYNVYPAEVEAVLEEHPKVALAAVVGAGDEVLGERGQAYVVATDPNDPPSADELRAFVAARIASYKVPDLVEIRPSLPMTSMYKVDKAALGAALKRT